MTLCSENSTVPGFVLASSAIHRRFVDRFAGFMPPPVFPVDGSLLATPPFPPSFPALSGTMKALRLPTRLSPVAYWFAPAAHTILRCSCSLARSRKDGGSLPGQGLFCRLPLVRLPACGREWDLSGLQTILPVPLLRSRTPV